MKKIMIGILVVTVIVGGFTFALYKSKQNKDLNYTKTEAIKINSDGTQEVKNEKIPVYHKYVLPQNTHVTEKEKNSIQVLINGIGDIKEDEVEFKLIKMDYKDDGSIAALGVIRNGVKDTIVDVSVNLDITTLDGKPVAKGQFNFLEKEVGAVKANTTIVVPININPNNVILKKQKLPNIMTNNTLSYVVKAKTTIK